MPVIKNDKNEPEKINQTAIIYQVIDMGSQLKYNSQTEYQRKFLINFELPENKQIETDDGLKVFAYSDWVSCAVGDKATLGKILRACGIDPYADEFIDFRELLTKNINIDFGYRQKPDGTYSDKIAGVSYTPLKRGELSKDPVNDLVHFDFDRYNQAEFDRIPEKLQDIIKKSPEYQALPHLFEQNLPPVQNPSQAVGEMGHAGEDIPVDAYDGDSQSEHLDYPTSREVTFIAP